MSIDHLASKINDDFLTCEICALPFSTDANSPKAPKILHCLHTFCKEDLGKAIAPGATHIECFVCRIPTAIDSSRGVDSIKTNFPIQNLIATLSSGTSDKTSSSSNSQSSSCLKDASGAKIGSASCSLGGIFEICEHCPTDVDACFATHICLQCEDETFCVACSEQHNKVKKFKNHECVLISTSLKKVNRKCSIHPTKPLEFICETCDPKVLLCLTCEIDNSHRDKGHKVVSIDKFVANQKESITASCLGVEKLLNTHKEIAAKIDSRIEVHRRNVEDARNRINSLQSRIIEIVNTAASNWLANIESEGSKTGRILTADKKAVQIHISNAELFIGQVKSIISSETGVQFYEQSTKALESLKTANDILLAPFTLTDVAALKTTEIFEDNAISTISRLFQTNPFKLPENVRIDVTASKEGGIKTSPDAKNMDYLSLGLSCYLCGKPSDTFYVNNKEPNRNDNFRRNGISATCSLENCKKYGITQGWTPC
jgi:hypothetical protein